jgi:protein TonB
MFSRKTRFEHRFGKQFYYPINELPNLPVKSEYMPESVKFVPKNTPQNPQFDLGVQYRRTMELATMAGLLLILVVFQLSRDIRFSTFANVEAPDFKIEVAEIPPTEQLKRPPPPPRPAIPIPTESEEIPEDATIETTELTFAELPPPPPVAPDDDEPPLFVPYDEPPEIIGGYAALFSKLEYPEIARRAGIEGTVIINVEVDEKGAIRRMEVLKGSARGTGFEEAAIKALKQMKWKPAYVRDRPIKVWVTIPVKFKLT